MKEIKIFSSPMFGEIRTCGTSEQPLFCLADVCRVLELRTDKVASRMEDGNLSKVVISDSLGREQIANFINEDGLYDAILDSRKPSAKKFRKWVTSEVLPSIRKSGGYMMARQNETDEELFARAVLMAQDTLARRDAKIKQLKSENERQARELTCVKAENDTLKAKQSYIDVVLQCKATVTVTQIAQDYGMSAKAMNRTLNEMGVQRKVNGQWILYGKYLTEGYVQSETFDIMHRDGTPDVALNTRWTQKGRLFLYNMLKSRGILPLIERMDLARGGKITA